MSEAERNWECTIEGRFVKPCSALEGCIVNDSPFSQKRGISVFTSYSKEKPGAVANMLVLRDGKFAKTGGIIMNYCPFCGKDVYPDREWQEMQS